MAKWCKKFDEGRTDVHEQMSGRPSVITDDFLQKIEEKLRDDRHFTLNEGSIDWKKI